MREQTGGWLCSAVLERLAEAGAANCNSTDVDGDRLRRDHSAMIRTARATTASKRRRRPAMKALWCAGRGGGAVGAGPG